LKEFLVTDVRGPGVTLTLLVVVMAAIGMVGPAGVSAQASSELAADGRHHHNKQSQRDTGATDIRYQKLLQIRLPRSSSPTK
jgi:hypothetical protein